MAHSALNIRNLPAFYKRLNGRTIEFDAMADIVHHWHLRQQAGIVPQTNGPGSHGRPAFNTKNIHLCFARPASQPLPEVEGPLYNPTHMDRQYTFYGLNDQWRFVRVVVPTPKATRNQASDQILAYMQRHPEILPEQH